MNKYESLRILATSSSVRVATKEEVTEAQEFLLRVKDGNSPRI